MKIIVSGEFFQFITYFFIGCKTILFYNTFSI